MRTTENTLTMETMWSRLHVSARTTSEDSHNKLKFYFSRWSIGIMPSFGTSMQNKTVTPDCQQSCIGPCARGDQGCQLVGDSRYQRALPSLANHATFIIPDISRENPTEVARVVCVQTSAHREVGVGCCHRFCMDLSANVYQVVVAADVLPCHRHLVGPRR